MNERLNENGKRGGGQSGCEQRSEVFVKIKIKNILGVAITLKLFKISSLNFQHFLFV